MKLTALELQEYKRMQQSPLLFVEKVWGLKLQPVKREFKDRLAQIAEMTGDAWEVCKLEVKPEWFGDFDKETNRWYWGKFERGKHLTWQQWLILLSMEKAVKKESKNMISIASGRGIGKSASVSWIMIWFLFSFPDCQIPCTAPGFQQMYDVLWKEIALWIHRMPPNIKNLYEWESSHVRIKESPYTWFARAKTASKENPEALSGIHADYVLALVDEASAVSDEIFEASHGIFSSPNPFMLMISNPTQKEGYFFDSHHGLKHSFQCLQFSSEESPVVHHDLLDKYADQGVDSDKYGINVLGRFPVQDVIDSKSYIRLLDENSIRMERLEYTVFRDPVLGVDPSGEGDNETAYCVRDNFVGKIVGTDRESTSKSIARSIMTLADKFRIGQRNIVVDAFGAGADVSKEVALAVRWSITSVNVVEKPDDDRDAEEFVNKRSEMYWKLKLWLEKGGILDENQKLKEQLLAIKFRRTENGGKIQIMPKKVMRSKEGGGIAAVDLADALALTFLRKPGSSNNEQKQKQVLESQPFNKWGI